jgi:hypothetical protein
MAVYFDLAVDCGSDESLANKLLQYFNNLILHVPHTLPVPCKTYKEYKRDHWIIGVWPEGMGYGTHPCRRELVKDDNREFIKIKLYEALKELPGFRRALFYGEAYDYFCHAEPEEDNDIDSIDMIFSSATFPQPAQNLILAPFSEGYLLVVGKK